ncbi:MAG: DUF502 domain-containing protein [Marinicellaceae bacterium]
MKNLILKPLLKGSLIVFPVLITVWVVWGLVKWIDALGQKALAPFMLDYLLFPGSGFVIVVILLIGVGLLFHFSFIKWAFVKIEKYLLKFPLVKTVYSAMKDLAGMFDNNQSHDQQVVLVDMQSKGLGYVVGMITNKKLPPELNSATHLENNLQNPVVAVYLPMSYMVGGYTVLVHTDQVKVVDWSFEEAMRFALTAGVSQKQ